MPPNAKRTILSNGADRVTVFHDGRVKVTSSSHVWDIVDRGRHSALGQYVTLAPAPARHADVRADDREAAPGTPDFVAQLDPELGSAVAGTAAATNGTFVQFVHDGTIIVGNDGRDLAETFNTGREATEEAAAERGGAVTVTFKGSYRPRDVRDHDWLIEIPPKEKPFSNRLYRGDYENPENKVGPHRR